MNFIQKKYLIFITILFISFSLFAQNKYQNKRIVVLTPTTEGFSSGEESWIPSAVRRKIEANFYDYSSFVIVDAQNERTIKELQAKSDSFAYDEDSTLQLGKLLSAEYALFSTITKANKKYILSASITDLTTGIKVASSTTESVEESVNLFEGSGCSANFVTVKLCEDLDIFLSSVDKYELLQGNSISEDEEINVTKNELQNYQDKISELDKQIGDLSYSSDLDSETKKARIEAEKLIIEQQEKITQAKLERLQLQQEKILQDEKDQLSRTDEQRKKIQDLSREVELKAEELRKTKIKNLSLDEQIAVIESKKQTLVEIRNSMKEQRENIKKLAEDTYKTDAAKIDDVPLRKGELDANGNMLPSIKQKRDKEKAALREKIDKALHKDLQEFEKDVLSQEDELLKSITNDLSSLKTKRTISSLQDKRILTVENYAGDSFYWIGNTSLFINDYCIFEKKVKIEYSKVTNKQPVSATSTNTEKWNEYLDTVDLYDSMFRRQIPIICLEMDYVVEAMPDNYPSSYKVTILEYRLIDVVSNKVVEKIPSNNATYTFQVNPVVDIRLNTNISGKTSKKVNTNKGYYTGTVIIDDENTYSKSESVDTIKRLEEVRKSNRKKRYDQSKGYGGRHNLGYVSGDVSDFYTDDSFSFYVYYTKDISSYFFIQFDFGLIPCPQYFNDYVLCDNVLANWNFSCGFNFRVPVLFLHPNFYFGAGFGGANNDAYVITSNNNSYKKEEAFHVYKAFAGVDLPIFKYFSLTSEFGAIYVEDLGWSTTAYVGAAITFPD